MSYDRTPSPERASDTAARASQPPADAVAPPRRMVIHPLLLVMWPVPPLLIGGSWPPRRRLVFRRRKAER